MAEIHASSLDRDALRDRVVALEAALAASERRADEAS